MRDGFGRRALKACVRFVFTGELAFRRWLARRRGEERWAIAGECVEGCGACCERPSVRLDRATFHLRSLRALFVWWNRVVNGFELVGFERPRLAVFRCTHWDPATKACDSYDSRPTMCRDYPKILLEQPWPEFFPQCGYRVVDQKAEGMLVALKAHGVSPEQQAELKKRLRLE